MSALQTNTSILSSLKVREILEASSGSIGPKNVETTSPNNLFDSPTQLGLSGVLQPK